MIDQDALLKHAGFIRSLARSLVSDDATADDVVQSTFLAAVSAPLRDERAVRPWLARVATNFARRLRRDRGTRERLDHLAVRPERIADPAPAAIHEEAIRGVVDAVFGLAEPYRMVIVFRFYEGLQPGEIAARLSIPVETVRTRLKRAIAQMREALDAKSGGNRDSWSLALIPLLGNTEPSATTTAAATSVESGRSAALVPPPALAAALLLTGSALFYFLVFDPFKGDATDPSDVGAAPAVSSPPPSGETAATATGRGSFVPVESPQPASGDRPVPATTATGSLLVSLRWEEDDTPAAGVRLRIAPRAETAVNVAPEGHRLDRISQLDGTVRIAELEAGDYTLLSDRMEPRHEVKIHPARETELRILVPPGTTVQGLVAGPTGSPIAGAEIVFASRAATDLGAVVARSAEDGTFRVRSVSVTGFMGARASMFSPSMLSPVSGEPGRPEVVSLGLRLVEPGGDVEGRVEGPDGRPISGADVVLGTEFDDRLDSAAPAHTIGLVSRSRRLLSDVDGAFRFPGVASGETQLLVRSPSHGPSRMTIRVEPGITTRVDLRLEPGPSLEGTIRYTDGKPAPGVRIVVNAPGFADARITLGGLTGPDGRYRVEHVFPDTTIRVQALETIQNLLAEASLDIGTSGATLWDASLAPVPRIIGRLVDENGSPLAGWGVFVTAPETDPMLDSPYSPGFWSARMLTDADGRFELYCRDRAHRLQFWEPGQWSNDPCADHGDVTPSPVERIFSVPSSARPSAFVTGRVESTRETPLGAAEVWAKPPSAAFSNNVAKLESDGSFRLGPLIPRRYNVYVGVDGFTFNLLEDEEIASGETRNLGVIPLPEPGSVAVELRRSDGKPIGRPAALVYDSRGELAGRVTQLGDVLSVASLAPGRYRFGLLASEAGVDVVSEEHDFEIRSGEETRFGVELRSGVSVPLRFFPSPGEEWTSSLRAVLRDETGLIVWRIGNLGSDPDRQFRVAHRLLPGRYTIEAVGDTGMTASHSFEITADGPATQAVAVALEMPR